MDNPVNFTVAENGQGCNESFQSPRPSSVAAMEHSAAMLEGKSMPSGDTRELNKMKKGKSKKDKKKKSKSKMSKSSLHPHNKVREDDGAITSAGHVLRGVNGFDDEVASNEEDDTKLPAGATSTRGDLDTESLEREQWDELACPEPSISRSSASKIYRSSHAVLPMHHVASRLPGSMADQASRAGSASHAVRTLPSFADENMSVLTSDEFSSQIIQDMRSVNDDDVSHDLLVSYMVSMGADRATADQLAYRFAAEQNRSALEYEERSFRFTRPPSMGTNKAAEVERLNSRYRSGSDEGSIADNTPTLTQGTELSAPVAYAISLKESESHLPIVYAESNEMNMKQLLNERPVRRMIFMAVGLLISVVIGVVVYFTAFKPQETGLDINAPSTSPSLAPTFISGDIIAMATDLSGFVVAKYPSSPQMRAVGWMSSFDEAEITVVKETFAQRYALVVMYFSFKGEGWTDQEQWLDPTLHECEWSKGIFCEYDATETRVVTGFDATRNNLEGNIPNEIGLLTSAQTFRISGNNVGGTIPSSIGNLPLLSAVDLNSNAIEGIIPSTIGGASNLVLLDFSENNLNSTIPIELYTLKFLRILKMKSNKLSGQLNEKVNDLQALVTIDLSNNELTGTLPLTLDTISTLETIWLDHNQFTGELPNITNSLALKQSISLSHNKLSGNAKLSPDFDITKIDDKAFQLKYVDVSFNDLSGPIAAVFFFLPTLRYFDISGNAFVGTFPSNVGWLGIEHLAAASNALSGTIPAGWPTLSKCLDCVVFPIQLGKFVH
jgi:Leucine-rich repeat (LRR) protein